MVSAADSQALGAVQLDVGSAYRRVAAIAARRSVGSAWYCDVRGGVAGELPSWGGVVRGRAGPPDCGPGGRGWLERDAFALQRGLNGRRRVAGLACGAQDGDDAGLGAGVMTRTRQTVRVMRGGPQRQDPQGCCTQDV